jgi:hypothetical protein
MNIRATAVLLFLAAVSLGQVPSLLPSSSAAARLSVHLEISADKRDVVARVGKERFRTVAELKTFIAALPADSSIAFWVYVDKIRHDSDFQRAGGEIRKLCHERGISFTFMYLSM